MSAIRALFVIVVVLAMAITSFAAEIGKVIEVRYGYDQADKNVSIDTAQVDTAFYAEDTRVRVIDGNENSPQMLVLVWSVKDTFFVSPQWIATGWFSNSDNWFLQDDILVIRQKPESKSAEIDAKVGNKVFSWLRVDYVGDVDSLNVAMTEDANEVFSNLREQFVNDSLGFQGELDLAKRNMDAFSTRWNALKSSLVDTSLSKSAKDSLSSLKDGAYNEYKKWEVRNNSAETSLKRNWSGIADSLESVSAISLKRAIVERRQRYAIDSTGFAVALTSGLPDSLKRGLATISLVGEAPEVGDSSPVDHLTYIERKPETTKRERAQEIMGAGNTFDIDEAARCFNVEVDSETQRTLSSVPFSEETLRRCKNTHLLVADLGLSIEEMQKSSGSLFYKANWFQSESFVTKKSALSWHLIRKDVVPGSEKKNWQEQSSLLSGEENVPEARVVVYASILSCRLTGKKPFDRIYVRTNSMMTNGNRRVIVGQFDGSGLNLLAEEDYETFVTRSYSDPFLSIGLISAMR